MHPDTDTQHTPARLSGVTVACMVTVATLAMLVLCVHVDHGAGALTSVGVSFPGVFASTLITHEGVSTALTVFGAVFHMAFN